MSGILQGLLASVGAAAAKFALYSWGYNNRGQLGINYTVDLLNPTQIGALTEWEFPQSSSGPISFAIKSDQTLWAWGYNGRGELGDGTSISRSSPVQIGTNWLNVGAAYRGTTGIKTDNTLWGWGQNAPNFTPNVSSPTQIGALTNWLKVGHRGDAEYPRGGFVCIKTDGTLWSWGDNAQGSVGDGTTTGRSSPVQIGALTDWTTATKSCNYQDKAAMGIRSGALYAWGSNANGALGLSISPVTNVLSPTQVGGLTTWVDASIGNGVCAIKTDGTIWGWGSESRGSNGLNDGSDKSSPVQIGALTNWASIRSRQWGCAAVKTDGTMWGWGSGRADLFGTTGDGTYIDRSSPVQVGALTNWSVNLGTGLRHVLGALEV